MDVTDFLVPRWLRNAHLQTVGASARLFTPPRSHASTASVAVRIPLPRANGVGESQHRLHARVWWATEDGSATKRPIVVIVHGIGGSSESPYVVRAAVALHRVGYHVVRLDLRGAGESIPDAPSLYHAGLSADLQVALRHFSGDPRVDGVAVLGFSGGGSLALKLGGELGERAPTDLRAIVAVSAPLDYTRVVRWMDALGRLPYRFHVLRGLSQGARAFARTHPDVAHYRPRDVKRLSSFRHYDSTVIVPMHGFPDVDTYYADASSGPWLGKICTPTLLMHSQDDPMVPWSSIAPWIETRSSAVDLAMTPHGGHLGWVAGFDEASWITGWSMRRALAFLETHAPPA